MHELSIALRIVEMAQSEGERRGARVEAVHVRLGPLSGVVKEALLSAYELACENTTLAGSSLLVEDVPMVIYCPRCEARRQLDSMRFLCPECGTPAKEILQGRELEIFALELRETG
jgi:hydrogenase nickel incorporation protein HypA/HybF